MFNVDLKRSVEPNVKHLAQLTHSLLDVVGTCLVPLKRLMLFLHIILSDHLQRL